MTRLTIIQGNADQATIPVLLDGRVVGQLHRSLGVSGLWRDAVLVRDNGAMHTGLRSALAALVGAYGITPEVRVEIHPGYHIIYGADGWPWARIIASENCFQLRVFDPHHSERFPTIEAATRAGRYPDIQ